MTPAVVARPRNGIHVLLVEDRATDAEFVVREFRLQHPQTVVEVAVSGLDALRRLHEQTPAAPLALVVLDLRLPGMDGLEVLSRMRAEPRLRAIPVAILTGSQRAEDVAAAYDLGARCCLAKPAQAAGYQSIVRQLAALCGVMAQPVAAAAAAGAPAPTDF